MSTSRSPTASCRTRRSTPTTTCTRTRDALTKFLPPEYEGIVRYVDIDGRTKLAIQDRISDYIPNPTFSRVAVPGGAGYDVTQNRRRPATRAPRRTEGFGKLVAMPSIDAFFDPEPRLELMKEMGIDRTLLWPTLASVVEERLANDPDAVCAVVHALNEWLHEHWILRVLRRDLLDADHQPRRRQRRRARRSSSTSPSAAPRSS